MRLKNISDKQKDWVELCEYIKLQILGYPDEMKFPKDLVYRIRGLSEGKLYSNKKTQNQAKYDFKTILYTCKICRPKIVKYLNDNQTKIQDEHHKINLVMMFIEKEINDVYLRLQQAKKTQDKVKDIKMDNQINQGADYQSQSKDTNTDKKLKDLW